MVSVESDGVKRPSLSSIFEISRGIKTKTVDAIDTSTSNLVKTKLPCARAQTGFRLSGVEGAEIDIHLPSGASATPAAGRALGSRGAAFPEATAVSLEDVAHDEPSLPPSSSAVPRRWALLHRIQRLCRPVDREARGPSVCGCGRPGYDVVSINVHLRPGVAGTVRAGVSGVYRCGSPWLCPTCAPARAHLRAERVQRAADATYERGGAVALVVLTASHRLDTPLVDIKGLVATASRKARQGRAWRDVTEAHGILGVIVGQEVTVSAVHGWHYHQHLSVLVDGREDETAEATRDRVRAAGDAVAGRYKAAIRAAGGRVSDRHGCRVRVADDADDASTYTAKGSAAWEIAGGHKDQTKSSTSMTPWDLAESAYRGMRSGASAADRWAHARWMEYAEVMPGTRSCVVSPNLARALGIVAADDTETGEQVLHESDDVVGRVETSAWKIWMKFGLVASFLARVEAHGEVGCATAIAETEAVAAAIAHRCAVARADAEMLTPDRPAPPMPDPVQIAAEHDYLRAHLVRNAAARIGTSAGTRAAIERVIEGLATACPTIAPPTEAEIIQAMAA